MTTLANNEYIITPSSGKYVVVTTMSSGTSKLQISLDDGTSYADITDASWSATATATVHLPNDARARAVLTGDATFDIVPAYN